MVKLSCCITHVVSRQCCYIMLCHHAVSLPWAYQELPSILHLPLWQVCAIPAPGRSAPHQSTSVLFAGFCTGTGQLSLWRAASSQQTVSHWLGCVINIWLFTILLYWHGCLWYKLFSFTASKSDPCHDHWGAAAHLKLHLHIEETGTKGVQQGLGNCNGNQGVAI